MLAFGDFQYESCAFERLCPSRTPKAFEMEEAQSSRHLTKIYFLVAIRIGETPVHISNTMVKPYPAWDTALATVWESRWLPGFLINRGL